MAPSLSYGNPVGSLSSALGSFGTGQAPLTFGAGFGAYDPNSFMPGLSMGAAPAAVAVPTVPTAPIMSGMNATNAPTQAGMDGVTGNPADFSIGGFAKGLLWQDGKLNLGGLKTAADIASALGGLWGGFQQNKLAKEMLSTQREAYKTNLSNQISTFNTSLSDRAYSRYAQEGRSAAEADAYIAKNKLGS